MFNIGLSYNFATLAPSILGAQYTNMKVIAITSLTEAVKYYADMVTRHETLKGIIPGLPVLPNNLTFVVFEDASGNRMTLAVDYIDPTSIVVVKTLNLDIKVYDATPVMESVIKQALKELGVTNFTVNTF